MVKSAYIGSTYFDASASAFIMPALHARAAGTNSTTQSESTCSNTITSHTATAEAGEGEVSGEGYALGPEWIAKSAAKAFLQEQRDSGNGENGSLQVRRGFLASTYYAYYTVLIVMMMLCSCIWSRK